MSKNDNLRRFVVQGDLSMVTSLIDQGADVNAKNSAGWTSLHLAAVHGHPNIVEKLIKKGADVNIQNKYGETPLDIARDKKHEGIVSFLESKKEKPLQRERRYHDNSYHSHLSRKPHKHRHHHRDHPRHYSEEQRLLQREKRSIHLELKEASSSIENVDSIVNAAKGVYFPLRAASPEKSVNSVAQANISVSSVESTALLTSGGQNNATVTTLPKINATVVNNTLLLGILIANSVNKTQHRQPIHENLLPPIKQSMKFIDEDTIMRAIQQVKEEFGDPGTDIDGVKISGNKTGMWKGNK